MITVRSETFHPFPLIAGVPVMLTDRIAVLYMAMAGDKAAVGWAQRLPISDSQEEWRIGWQIGTQRPAPLIVKTRRVNEPVTLGHLVWSEPGYFPPHMLRPTYRLNLIRVGRAHPYRP